MEFLDNMVNLGKGFDQGIDAKENEVQVFVNEQFGQVRVQTIEGEPWFVAADVCRVLEIGNSRMATDRLDDDEKNAVSLTDAIGRTQVTTIVSEPGLYSLVLRSRKPQAKAFKRWLTHEVIPAIRRHKAYITPTGIEEILQDPDAWIRILTALKEEQQKSKRLAEEKALLNQENALLSEQTLSWDYRSFINAAVRTFGYQTGKGFAKAWSLYKKELLYKLSININARITYYRLKTGKGKPYTTNCILDEELSSATGVIIAMCRENDVSIDQLLANIDYRDSIEVQPLEEIPSEEIPLEEAA